MAVFTHWKHTNFYVGYLRRRRKYGFLHPFGLVTTPQNTFWTLVEPSVVFPASAVVVAADAASNAIEELSNLVGRNVEPCLCAFPKPIDLSLLPGG